MTTNILIGMGGTGSKIVESFIHLCGAGMGPDAATVGLVEQDASNGNRSRALETLGSYLAVQDVLRGVNSDHQLPEGCEFMTTRLSAHAAGGGRDADAMAKSAWTPHQNPNATFGTVIGYPQMSGPAKNLARVLFRDDDRELGMSLHGGYRGHAHVGSMALLYETDHDWWRELKEKVEQGANGYVKVFLAGSAFGGTGASALPTLARQIRAIAREKGVKGLRISAALMLPYFSFKPADEEGANVVKAHQLLQQTKASLEDYHSFLTSDGVFDELYLIGWDPLFMLNYHAPDSAEQKNPPLAPEIIAALAAARDFRMPQSDAPAGRASVIARAQSSEFSWPDLPVPAAGISPMHAYGRWLRFCMLWQREYRGALDPKMASQYSGQKWYGNLLGKKYWEKPPAGAEEALNKVDDYIRRALSYAALMSAFSQGGGKGSMFQLWDSRHIGQVDTTQPNKPPILHTGGNVPEALDSLVKLSGEQKDAPKMAELLRRLTDKKPGKRQGLGMLVGALHEASGLKVGG
jgi:hypothetical protein